MTQAYPLAWPAGWPRTEAIKRQRSNFKNVTVYRALTFVENELRLLGGKQMVVSSNATLGNANPKDPGVCIYFHYDGVNVGIPCDRWNKVEDNLHAIGKTIEAMRGIDRWGAKNMVKAAFTGFAALPAPGKTTRTWRAVFGWREGADISATSLETAYRRLRSETHPDRPGGSAEAFNEVQVAYEQARLEVIPS